MYNDYKFRHLEKINCFHFSNSSPKDMGKATNQGEVISLPSSSVLPWCVSVSKKTRLAYCVRIIPKMNFFHEKNLYKPILTIVVVWLQEN